MRFISLALCTCNIRCPKSTLAYGPRQTRYVSFVNLDTHLMTVTPINSLTYPWQAETAISFAPRRILSLGDNEKLSKKCSSNPSAKSKQFAPDNLYFTPIRSLVLRNATQIQSIPSALFTLIEHTGSRSIVRSFKESWSWHIKSTSFFSFPLYPDPNIRSKRQSLSFILSIIIWQCVSCPHIYIGSSNVTTIKWCPPTVLLEKAPRGLEKPWAYHAIFSIFPFVVILFSS